MVVEHRLERMTSADQAEWVPVFTSLSVRQFRKLVRIVVHRGGEQSGTGRRWSLPFADRVLLFTEYYRTNLTLRSVALQFGVSKSGAHRVVDHLAPLRTLAPIVNRHGPDTALIVAGTLVPTHHQSITAPSRTTDTR
ncbi:helix-turn-helix domain-containing protein [Actinomadura xylanilytica]|uniref:helix-turn-helix domain-containing protein n=1 Tax=Actinomadura xylanilytica TaxID=887459 RepID=UPI00255AB4FD|nr:transposase family protein [Actinomadura xylanilytica]MDL4770602.1 transposase family protein [Actinomadura xylanilytica]